MSKKMNLLFITSLTLLLISLLGACAVPATTTGSPATSAKAVTSQTPITSAPEATTAAPKPQGELVGALSSFGNENWLPWLDPTMANLHDVVYDLLIYWDNVNRNFIPGLAENWEVTPDGLTLTYHLRKGVQFVDGWGELTSADVKYNFEMQASSKSIGKAAQCRRIASMDAPDPYTLVVHFKDPYPTFFVDLSMANSGVCQGIVCKKYLETVGEETASQKPIGTGPYKLVDNQSGSYFKFEANETCWRVVPEFKTLTVRLVTETSTLVAALKNKEIDLSNVPADQLEDLKAAGLAAEVSPFGGTTIFTTLGGLIIPEDKRYNADIHNKDPWIDPRVRKALATSIDRQAIAKAIYAGLAQPAGVPLLNTNSKNFQYPYDPVAARLLLKDAGYPDGFTFNLMSYAKPGYPDNPRVLEALAGFWQRIGLKPKIIMIDYGTYNSSHRGAAKTAGEVSLESDATIADLLLKVEMYFLPNVVAPMFQDAGSYALYKDSPKATFEQRSALANQLNKYYYDNVSLIPIVVTGYCFAWNPDKILPWPHPDYNKPVYFEYVRHNPPLNTFRLFNPMPDR